MGLHVYCIVPAGSAPPAELRGLDNAAVRGVPVGDLVVWVSDALDRPRPDAGGVRVHNSVIEAAMTDQITPVPSRFGQWFDSDHHAVAAIITAADRWRDLLRRVAGHVEFGVRITGADQPVAAREMHPAQAVSGTQYMKQLANRRAQVQLWRAEADRLAALIAGRAGNTIADSRTEVIGSRVLSLAHLVARQDVGAYHTTLQEVRAGEPALRFLLTGPWPPYSFVG
ncbi:MAG: GvpL/GvpF family gas vesicle protein [Gemmatimonadota bacterium]